VTGAVRKSAPVVTVNVTVVFALGPGASGLDEDASTAGPAEAAVAADAANGVSAKPAAAAAARIENALLTILLPL
jgi:hypothetical protein